MSIILPKDRTEIKGLHVSTKTPVAEIIENIKTNKDREITRIQDTPEWRGALPIAIVGGGPSLKKCLDELRGFKYILAAGSVHDYLIDNDIMPTWCVVCDADPIVNKYIKHRTWGVKYLVASQCSPKTFEYLEGLQVALWHTASDNIKFDEENYGVGAVPIGGGSSVGTRAMVLAMGLGFYNLHLFGLDTCLSGEGERYSYPLQEPEYEGNLMNDLHEIVFEEGGPVFRVLGYHLAQLFDIKLLSHQYANRMMVTVHGDSLLSYFYELAQRKLKELKEKENGDSNGPHGIGLTGLPSS